MLVAIYWKARASTLEEATKLLQAVFTALADAGYKELRHRARSRKAALAAVFTPDADSVRQLLEKGINRRDMDRSPIPELGFSFGLWSGGPEASSYAFDGQVGNVTSVSLNRLLLNLPPSGPLSFAANETAVRQFFWSAIALAQAEEGIICDPLRISWTEDRHLCRDVPAEARHG